MSLPFYKRFARDFLEGTAGMSLELKGAYAVIIDLLHLHDGRLPNCSRYIGGQLGCSTRKATSLIDQLLEAEKLYKDGSVLRNKRSDKLISERSKKRQKSLSEDYREIIAELSPNYRPDNVEKTQQKQRRFFTESETDTEPELDTGKSIPHENYKPLSSSSKDGLTTDDDGFEVFWVEFCHAQSSSKTKAKAVWDRLGPDERLAALDAAKAMTEPPERGVLAFSWLEERHWRFDKSKGGKPVRPDGELQRRVFDALQSAGREVAFAPWFGEGRVTYGNGVVHPASAAMHQHITQKFGHILRHANIAIGDPIKISRSESTAA